MNFIQGGFALIGMTLSAVFFLLSIRWAANPSDSKGASYWLSVLSVAAFIQYTDFLYISFQLYTQWPILYCLMDPITVLLPLCLYGHMRALQGHNIFTNKVLFLRHLFPSLLVLILDMDLWTHSISHHILSISSPIEADTSWFPSTPHGNVYWLIVGVMSLFYWWRQKQHGSKSNVKPLVMRIQFLLWMTALLVLIKIISIEAFNIDIPMAYIQGSFSIYFVYTVLNFTVLPLVVHSVTVRKNDILQSTEPKTETGIGSSKELSPDELSAYKAMFDTLDESLKNGAYRDNELSLRSLAASCNMSYHQASSAINHLSGVNFYEWVSLYRIAESKEILAKTKLSVSTIYYDVGFNSKSSFYTSFKKIVGCTPTEYRKSLTHNT